MSKLEIRPWKETFWKTLKSLDPADVCARALVDYNDKSHYSLTCINSKVKIFPATGIIEDEVHDKASLHPEYELLLLSYLIHSTNIPLSGEWISERDIPRGSMFFRGPHCMPTREIEQTFGDNPEAFQSQGKKLGGSVGSFGDISIQLQVLPRIPVTLVLWIGDDEFPPRCHFLFDRTVGHHLPLDVLLALSHTVVRKCSG